MCKTFLCHSEEHSDEESRWHPLDVPEILRFALDDIHKKTEKQ